MPRTPDRTPGPMDEEEIRFEDRTSDGDPTVEGALRRVGDYLRFKPSSAVEQVLTAVNYEAGFAGLDLTGAVEGDALVYDSATKNFKPGQVQGQSQQVDLSWRRHFLLMGG